MSLIGLILLFLFIWYVVRPTVKFFMTVNRLRDQARSAYQNGAPKQPRSRRPGWTVPSARKKKIDRGVGEYVEYEEIACTTRESSADTGRDTVHTQVEEQITDVEWEDIK